MVSGGYEKKWEDAVRMNAFDVYALELNDDIGEVQMEIFSSLLTIFIELKKMSRGRFFKRRELDVFWLMLKNEIVYLHELCDEWLILNDVYIIIDDIFRELIKITESESDYECADNLLKFRKEWFATFKIKNKLICE